MYCNCIGMLVAFPIAEVWNVSGTLNKGNVAFSAGKVYAKLQAELERRKKEWTLEDEMADAEVVEVEKQEVVNEIKTQQVEKRHKSIENEILRSEQVYEVLSEKFTNNDLYVWLEKELGKVFRQYVNLLIDVAKMAERAYHFEIDGTTDTVSEFIGNNYWDSFYKGLLAPERILLDLRRMEKAYLEKDVKEMEIARAIRLSEFNKPDGSGALKKLQDEGTCQILLDNQFWTNEFANHSFRRIRNVSVFVETVTSVQKVNVELTLLESKLANITDRNPETYASSITNTNPNFIDSRISAEKKHLFEGRGADSIWSLSVTGASGNQITDVIIYLNYGNYIHN